MEVVNGKLYWCYKIVDSGVIFDVKIDDVVIFEGFWSYVIVIYSFEIGDVKIYVNGFLRGSFNNFWKLKLFDVWGCVLIGGYLLDGKNFVGFLDEFFIYNWELDLFEVWFVLKYCVDKLKFVFFIVCVLLFK